MYKVYVCFTDFSILCILRSSPYSSNFILKTSGRLVILVVLKYISTNLDQKRSLLVRSYSTYSI